MILKSNDCSCRAGEHLRWFSTGKFYGCGAVSYQAEKQVETEKAVAQNFYTASMITLPWKFDTTSPSQTLSLN